MCVSQGFSRLVRYAVNEQYSPSPTTPYVLNNMPVSCDFNGKPFRICHIAYLFIVSAYDMKHAFAESTGHMKFTRYSCGHCRGDLLHECLSPCNLERLVAII